MEAFSALLALCARNSPVTGESPAQRSVARSFEVFFDLRLNEHLIKQSWDWWFETPSRPLWSHNNKLIGPNQTFGHALLTLISNFTPSDLNILRGTCIRRYLVCHTTFCNICCSFGHNRPYIQESVTSLSVLNTSYQMMDEEKCIKMRKISHWMINSLWPWRHVGS